jgi:hypothetical protein
MVKHKQALAFRGALRERQKQFNHGDTASTAKNKTSTTGWCRCFSLFPSTIRIMSTVVKLFFAFRCARRARRVAVVKLLLLFAERSENNLSTVTRRARRKAMTRILE